MRGGSPLAADLGEGPLPLQENAPPLGIGSGLRAKGRELGQKLSREVLEVASPLPREFGQPVDGVSSAGGLSSPALTWNCRSPQRQRVPFGLQVGGLPSQGLGLDSHRRKRPADPAVYVDDEFRDEAAERPSVRGFTPQSRQGAASTPATSSSGGAWTGSSPGEVRVGLFRRESPLTDAASSLLGDGDMDMEDKENSQRPAATARSLFDTSRALREMSFDVPPEYKDHPFSDIESSDESGEFRSEDLAGQLAERVRQNVDGRYDFAIYADPEQLG